MEVIPVIDLLNGEVVQAIKGERKNYKPIKSLLINSSRPLDVAGAFKEQFGSHKIYIADLNSILRRGNNFKIIRDIKNRLNLKIILDYGIRTAEDLRQGISKIVDYLIFGTETIASLGVLRSAIKLVEYKKIFVSIDMKGKILISQFEKFKNPLDIVTEFKNIGVINYIFLDLKKVGTMQGSSKALKELILEVAGMELYVIVGGGIRTLADIAVLQRLNVNAVLIATALHQKKVTKKDILQIANH